ncbi:protein FAM98B isoform X1 [Cynoglossus semilaevis]|uniref:Im:7138535 n=2 Tax=Cynoglossus semilaevis TaxID=244447 RepID=A0A3P8VLL2_CYNSE|nr:protein FAM98B-like isoform X1 [Cynoglossus semilaevis]
MERNAVTVAAIKSLGYPCGPCLHQCGCEELPCPLLNWLSAELRKRCPQLQESVGSSKVILVGELRSLLSNMFSPLTELTSGVLEPSVLNKVIEFLVSELQAARIINYLEMYPEEKTMEEKSEKQKRVKEEGLSHELTELCGEGIDGAGVLDEERRRGEMQAEWILLLRALDMNASSQFADVLSEVESRLARLPSRCMMDPLLDKSLTSEQWVNLKKISDHLLKDYQCRWQMMVKRFQVTLESFAWGEKQKERRKVLASVPPLSSLTSSSTVSLAHLLAARQDQSFIESIKAGPSTSVYKARMGSVPDRGGRPGEIEPPMPVWEERRAKGYRSGSGHHQRRTFSSRKKGKKE